MVSFVSAKSVKCSRCGYLHEHKQCPAKGQKCRKCGKLDHFKKMCRTKCVSEVNMEENDTDFEVDMVSTSFHYMVSEVKKNMTFD